MRSFRRPLFPKERMMLKPITGKAFGLIEPR